MAEAGEQTTIIGADTTMKGELTFERTAKIAAELEGEIPGKRARHVAQAATCKGDVDASSVNVDGTIEGNVNARERVQLSAKGTIRGDVTAGKMAMAEGASFFGNLSVGPEAVKGGKAGGSSASSSAPSTPSSSGGAKPEPAEASKK